MLIKRHYWLTEESIIYTQNENSKDVKKIMNLEKVKLTFLTHENYLAFQFSKNKEVSILFTDKESMYNEWRSHLLQKCIQLQTFHQEFRVTKLIGQGSFAKVYYAIKNENGKEYAIKAFSKKFILSKKNGKVI